MVPDGDGRRGARDRGQDDLPAVDLWFSGIRELTHRLRPWISTDGIFVATPEPKPPSSVVRVRLVLADGFVLAEGTAVVVWARTTVESPGGDPGMGMRWVVIPEPSRRVIEQLVAEHEAEGGQAFNPDRPPEGDSVSEAVGLEAEPTVIRSLPELGRELPRPAAGAEDASRTPPAASPEWQPPHGHSEAAAQRGSQRTDHEPLEQAEADHGLLEPPRAAEVPGPAVVGSPEEGSGAVVPAAPVDHREGSPRSLPEDVVAVSAPPDIVMPDEGEGAAEEAPLRRPAWPWLAVAAVVLVGAVVTMRLLGWSPGAGPVERPTPQAVAHRPTAPEPRAEREPTPAAADDTALREQVGSDVEPGAAAVVASQPTPLDVATEVPSPVASAVQPVANSPAVDVAPRGVGGITWSHDAGSTAVEISLGSQLASKDVSVDQFTQPPRILVRIPDVSESASPLLIPVGSPELVRVRSWLHDEMRPPELHVVLDLTGDRTSLIEVRREPHAVVLVIGGGTSRGGPS